jgi:HAD superfamily hydrolase (TIGR01459 family)
MVARMTIEQLASFSAVAERYDAFLCDLWGVIHDGDALYPGVLETLEAMHRAGKKLVFLSNAPRLADSVTTRMDVMGVSRQWYHGAMTSGEAAARWLSTEAPPAFQGPLYYLGLAQDAPLLDSIPQASVALEEASFLLNGNFEALGQSVADVEPLLHIALESGLPMLCINPDLEVVKLNGTRILCAGTIAEWYATKGGSVTYIGKPYPLIYRYGFELLGDIPKSRIAMIGDNLLTDIQGGIDAGIDTILVTQGVLQEGLQSGETIADYCSHYGVSPSLCTESLRWNPAHEAA